MAYDYFDEAYFQSGASKGTAYFDYLNRARSSEIYREIAELIAVVFRPVRALEVGCATGMIVRHLNEMGVESFGIDVSAWAVEHREHPNVSMSGVERLPFPDGHFDFVYSVHALEHVPPQFEQAAFAELARVCRGVQMHLLPIVGMGPYAGDRDLVIAGLRKDPTHHLLESREWWLDRFSRTGFVDALHGPTFFHESGDPDLSVSQLLLSRTALDDGVKDRLRTWNQRVLRACVRSTASLKAGLATPLSSTDSVQHRAMTMQGDWADAEFDPAQIEWSAEHVFNATVAVRADAPVALRFCMLTADGGECDLWREYPPGVTQFVFLRSDMQVRKPGEPNAAVERILFGGAGSGAIDVLLAVARQADHAGG